MEYPVLSRSETHLNHTNNDVSTQYSTTANINSHTQIVQITYNTNNIMVVIRVDKVRIEHKNTPAVACAVLSNPAQSHVGPIEAQGRHGSVCAEPYGEPIQNQ